MIPQNIILHCSATQDSETVSWDDIRRFHTEMRGWRDIGYHYGIEVIGESIAFLRGRNPWEIGAHCRAGGRNRDSLGLCVVGEFDRYPPHEDVYAAAVAVLTSLCFAFHIHPTHIYGHNEFESGKTCPGKKWDLAKTRRDVMREFQQLTNVGYYLEI